MKNVSAHIFLFAKEGLLLLLLPNDDAGVATTTTTERRRRGGKEHRISADTAKSWFRYQRFR